MSQNTAVLVSKVDQITSDMRGLYREYTHLQNYITVTGHCFPDSRRGDPRSQMSEYSLNSLKERLITQIQNLDNVEAWLAYLQESPQTLVTLRSRHRKLRNEAVELKHKLSMP